MWTAPVPQIEPSDKNCIGVQPGATVNSMDAKMRDMFVRSWRSYFGDSELPMAVYFSDRVEPGTDEVPGSDPCVVSMLPHIRQGNTLTLSSKSRMCGGAKRYLGFSERVGMKDFEYFLSYGIPGKLEGERYKKSPDLVREGSKLSPPFKAPRPYIVFKRWDKLASEDEPEVVVFFAGLDVVAGLFTLANFDEAEPNAVICPFGSGCSSMVYYPYQELRSQRPRCVLGMFDISARPCVGENTLSFAIPYPKFRRMVENMEESFLSTESWKVLRTRSRDAA
jgi:hypothetical protein